MLGKCMRIVTPEDAQKMEITVRGHRNILAGYFGKLATMHEGPQAILADLPDGGARIDLHYHDVDQFQVFVRGDGILDKHRLEPVTFHYSDAYTPSGPITAGTDGIGFITLRTGCTSGHFAMPGSEHLMLAEPGRDIAGRFRTSGSLPVDGQFSREMLIEEGDGVAVAGFRLGANATVKGEPTRAGYQYYVVCSGGLMHEGRVVPPLSLALVQAGEPAPTFLAGPLGAELLMLQFATPSDRPGSDPENLPWRDAKAVRLPADTQGVG
jgi:hypothetical protein